MDEKLQDISSDTSTLLAVRAINSIVRWLSPPDPSINYEQALKGLKRDSGSWYLNHQLFKDWRDAPQSTLWTTGIPGSGKTSICAAAIRELWPTCVYFFFDFQDPNKQTFEQLLRSLVFQLYLKPGMAGAHNWLQANISSLMEGYEQPLNERLYSALKGMLKMTGGIHIVIDAFDESIAQQEIRKFIGSITVECNVRILLTSCEKFSVEWFKDLPAIDRTATFWRPMTGQGLRKEIEAYVRRRVYDKSEAWNPGLPPARVISGVCKKAGGL